MTGLKEQCREQGLDFLYSKFLCSLNPDGQAPPPRVTRIGLIQNGIQLATTEAFQEQRKVISRTRAKCELFLGDHRSRVNPRGTCRGC